MTRPQIVRADTIDLQDPLSPSAQDHSHHPKGRNGARIAPHQTQAIRRAEQESMNENARSPSGVKEQRETSSYDDNRDNSVNEPSGDALDHYVGNGELGDDDNLVDSEGDDQLDDDLMDKISSSPSIDDEDIDFEFVYALHTFVATVEGQANATKGDTMVLLDDSNSYWWLVRVVKDGSIGYLPAEHIETPTERLARLNKHRNIDLSATMLGDNAEKSKNPLKKAMRRRNAKTVTFSSPTYFDAPEIDYSSEEEDDEKDNFFEEDEVTSREGSQESHDDESNDEDLVIEPLRPKQQQTQQKPQPQQQQQQQQQQASTDTDTDVAEPRTSIEKQNANKEFVQDGSIHGRSRHGTVRNTDSFFKDDSVETKKISLTPNLLRDDAVNSTPYEIKEVKGRGSFESFDKPGDRSKDDKKRKDKKPGMLSGLFKRKDKKTKMLDDDVEEPEKTSEESTRSYTPPKSSSESLKDDARSAKYQAPPPQRNPSKLQKAPPAELSPVKETYSGVDSPIPSPVEAEHKTSLHQTEAYNLDNTPRSLEVRSKQSASSTKPTGQNDSKSHSPINNGPVFASRTPSANGNANNNSPQLSESPDQQRPDQRTALATRAPPVNEESSAPPPKPQDSRETWPEDEPSAVYLTLASRKEQQPQPQQRSPQSSAIPPPEPAAVPQDIKTEDRNWQPSPTAAAAAKGPTWNDASLRAYLDDGSDIRDLLIIIHDRSNVPPTPVDHPITGSLFKEDTKVLAQMSTRLDDMLNSWLARKSLTYIR